MVMMPVMMILMLMVTMMVTMTMTMMMMVAMYRRRADLACSKSLRSSIFRTSALFTTMMMHDSGRINADDYDDAALFTTMMLHDSGRDNGDDYDDAAADDDYDHFTSALVTIKH